MISVPSTRLSAHFSCMPPFVPVKQHWPYSPSVFTVTTSLKGPVPSLFWARTLNWYVVSGSKLGTTIQSWPPGTGMESQSCGPKCSLFSLHRSQDERWVDRQKDLKKDHASAPPFCFWFMLMVQKKLKFNTQSKVKSILNLFFQHQYRHTGQQITI